MHDWDDLRFFLAVAQAGSVSAAAATLGVNQSTVSRRINHFEKILDVRLFERTTQGYQLTDEGLELQQCALRMEEEIQSIERDLMGKNVELRGPVRLTTSLVMAEYLIMPILKSFNDMYPEIEIQLDLSDSDYNISQYEADVALRVTPAPVPDNLIGKKLGLIELGVYAEKKYLKQYMKPSKKRLLHWIGEDNKLTRPAWLYPDTKTLKLVMRTNDVLATAAAVKQGVGVGRLPCIMGDSIPGLVRFADAPEIPAIPLWLLTHVDMRRLSRIKVFTTFMADSIRSVLNNI